MQQPTLYVVARYATDRAYGGPEEGGWYYTVGELEKVVLASRDQDRANEACWRLNTAVRDSNRRGYVSYDVVEIPRRELVPALREQMCHLDYEPDPVADYVTRWDVPADLNEGRPHYC